MASAIFDRHASGTAEILADEHAGLLASSWQRNMTSRYSAPSCGAMERRIKDQLTIRLGGMMAGAVAIIAALVRLL
jgi:hypothetical protein